MVDNQTHVICNYGHPVYIIITYIYSSTDYTSHNNNYVHNYMN